MDSLRAQAIERDHASDPPDRIEGLLDINVLPQRYRPQRPSFTTILAWFLFVVLVGLLYLSFQRFQEGTRELATQRLRFEAAQEALQAAEVQPAEIADLQTEVDALRAEADELQFALEQVNIQALQWGPQLRQLVAQRPTGIRLLDITQSGDEVLISGVAESYQQPLDYRDRLRQDAELEQVTILSITRIEAEALELETTRAETEPEEEEAVAATPSPEYLYQFELQLFIPSAVISTPTPEVSQ